MAWQSSALKLVVCGLDAFNRHLDHQDPSREASLPADHSNEIMPHNWNIKAVLAFSNPSPANEIPQIYTLMVEMNEITIHEVAILLGFLA